MILSKIATKLQTFKTRKQKQVPPIVDYFGWCTWDAFYKDVSLEKIRYEKGQPSFSLPSSSSPLISSLLPYSRSSTFLTPSRSLLVLTLLFRRGLESFHEGGIFPKFIIVDDGWQQYRYQPSFILSSLALPLSSTPILPSYTKKIGKWKVERIECMGSKQKRRNFQEVSKSWLRSPRVNMD